MIGAETEALAGEILGTEAMIAAKDREKCLKLFAANAARIAKFLLDLLATGRFFAVNVLKIPAAKEIPEIIKTEAQADLPTKDRLNQDLRVTSN